LDRDELKVFIEDSEEDLEEDEVNAAISFIDRNGDGLINLKEFIKFIVEHSDK
jgi:Ca2+-binding EF-hand superfamily protein